MKIGLGTILIALGVLIGIGLVLSAILGRKNAG